MSRYTKEVNAYLLAIQQGDMAQFEKLYESTANHIRGLARYYLVNKSLADDVVEETFLKILNYVGSFDCSKDGYNWMCKIAQNVANTINADEKKIAKSEEMFAKTQELIVSMDCLDDLFFFDKIKGLDETDRFVARHRFYMDESLEVIGRQLGVSRAAVCKRLKKICKIIEKKLKKGKQN